MTTKTAENVKVGDRIVGPRLGSDFGMVRRVEWVESFGPTMDPRIKVTFTDGTSIIRRPGYVFECDS